MKIERKDGQMDRRKFVLNAGLWVGAATLAVAGCSHSQSSTAPSPTPSTPQPNPPTSTSDYGRFVMGGFAGINGTLEQVLQAAQLNPVINNAGLMIALNGRNAQLAGSATRAGYIFSVRGAWFGNSIRELQMRIGDSWDLFDWNGKNPT